MDEKGKADDYRINNLKKIPNDKKVIVSEFVKEKKGYYADENKHKHCALKETEHFDQFCICYSRPPSNEAQDEISGKGPRERDCCKFDCVEMN